MVGPPRTVAQSCCLSTDGIHHLKYKADKLNLCYRAEALNRQAYCQTANTGFSQWCIKHSLLAEFLLQSLRRTEHTAYTAYILAEHKYI
ncbi:hypothetical protein D3C73_1522950 [compost metagenome]